MSIKQNIYTVEDYVCWFFIHYHIKHQGKSNVSTEMNKHFIFVKLLVLLLLIMQL